MRAPHTQRRAISRACQFIAAYSLVLGTLNTPMIAVKDEAAAFAQRFVKPVRAMPASQAISVIPCAFAIQPSSLDRIGTAASSTTR